MVSGVQVFHCASIFSMGLSEGTRGVSYRRIPGWLAAAMAASAFSEFCMVHCMLDCPEQSQTSPTSTSVNTTVSAPADTVKRWASAEVFSGSRSTRHCPEASAVAVFFCPANSTVTTAFGSAIPQTGTGWSRCSTMWSEKTDGRVNSEARQGMASNSETNAMQRFLIMTSSGANG